MHRLSIAIACLIASACAVADEDEPTEDGPLREVAQVVTDAQHERIPIDVCEVLPPSGACSAACDHDALAEYVPTGACASFYCELTDGRHLVVHACHPEE